MTSLTPTSIPLSTVSATMNFTITENNTLAPGNTPPMDDIVRRMLMQQADYRASLAVTRYGFFILLVLGTITNLLTIIVMTRRTMITSTTCFYFAILAIADLMVLYFSCLRRLLRVLNNHTDVFVQSSWSCRVWGFLAYFSFDFSSWILTVTTIDRFIAIRYPLKAALLCTIRNACIIVCGVAVLCTAKNMQFFFTFEMTARGGCLPVDAYVDFVDQVWPWIDAVFYSFLPFSILFLFNVLILYYHRQALKRKRMLQACPSISGASEINFNRRLTTMLIVVSFTFMAMTAPRVLLTSIQKKVFIFFPEGGGIDFAVIANHSLVTSIMNFLMFTNHSINFFLYGLSGKRFRQEFKRLLVQCVHCKRRGRVSASNLPRAIGQRSSTSSAGRRGSGCSVVSDDAAPGPALPPTESEDVLSRVNRWANISFTDNCQQQQT